MFGEQLLAFQDWTRWSNLVRALSMSNKMSEKVKLKQACTGKQTTIKFNPKATPNMLLVKRLGCFWQL